MIETRRSLLLRTGSRTLLGMSVADFDECGVCGANPASHKTSCPSNYVRGVLGVEGVEPDYDEMILVFAGAEYYPRGGFKDLKGRFKTLHAAMTTIESWTDYDWVQVWDLRTDNRGSMYRVSESSKLGEPGWYSKDKYDQLWENLRERQANEP